SVWRILLATAVGIPFGLLMLKIVPSAWVTHLLGALLIFYSLYTLLQTRWAKLEHPAWGYGFGFVSGALGSAYNTSGPPLVIYASLQRWSPEAFRATLQSCFLPTSLMILVGHALSGFWTPTVFALFGLSLPVILLAFGIGNVISRYILVEQFTMVVRVALLILGMMLLFKA
ncbi:MAG TPA: sulfite exporter TauE/SafE family protein, partial [Phototrophicaceae bacterium]|nr:sulfite exporter TauE/SafE family protein [Phototrophicaceae bacterium]